MLQVAKAHAYGNDFLFVPMEQAEGLRLDELSRRMCERYTGIGGDGLRLTLSSPIGLRLQHLRSIDMPTCRSEWGHESASGRSSRLLKLPWFSRASSEAFELSWMTRGLFCRSRLSRP